MAIVIDVAKARETALAGGVVMLPIAIPSLNPKLRCHWTKNKHERDVFGQVVGYILGQRRPGRQSRAKIEIVSYRHRALDYLNLVGGCKSLIDALVSYCWLRDDSQKWLDDEGGYKQVLIPQKEEEFVTVQISAEN